MTPAENQAALLVPFLREMEDVLATARREIGKVSDDTILMAMIEKTAEAGNVLLAVLGSHAVVTGQRNLSAAINNAIEEARPLSDDARRALMNTTMLAGVPQQ